MKVSLLGLKLDTLSTNNERRKSRATYLQVIHPVRVLGAYRRWGTCFRSAAAGRFRGGAPERTASHDGDNIQSSGSNMTIHLILWLGAAKVGNSMCRRAVNVVAVYIDYAARVIRPRVDRTIF